MTREQIKQNFEIVKAFSEGKDVQVKWTDGTWHDTDNPSFTSAEYRVKPKEEIIPMDFSDAERLIGKVIRVRQDSNHLLITGCEYACVTAGGYSFGYDHILKHCEFLDGSPIGKLSK